MNPWPSGLTLTSRSALRIPALMYLFAVPIATTHRRDELFRKLVNVLDKTWPDRFRRRLLKNRT
jgi:hypothetical protein